MVQSKLFEISGEDRVFYVKFFKDKDAAELFRSGILEFNNHSLQSVDQEPSDPPSFCFIQIPLNEIIFEDTAFVFRYSFFPQGTKYKCFEDIGEHAVIIPDYPFTPQVVDYFESNAYSLEIFLNEYVEEKREELMITEFQVSLSRNEQPVLEVDYYNVGNLGYTIYVPTSILLNGGFIWQDVKYPELAGPNNYRPGDVILEVNNDENQFEHQPVGFCIGEDQVLTVRNGKTKIVTYDTIAAEKRIRINRLLDVELREKALAFLTMNQKNPFIYNMGINAILNRADRRILDYPIVMPELDRKMSDEVFEERWESLLSDLIPGDIITTFNHANLVSKTIARVDGGVWSHIGTYLGDGFISEMLPQGITVRSIKAYKERNYHVGVYRQFDDLTDEYLMRLFAITLHFIKLDPKYNYKGALMKGIKMLTKVEDFEKITPNGIIYNGLFRLVNYV